MKKYIVYIFRCSDRSYFTGTTCDLAGKIAEHNNGSSNDYTFLRRPVTLEFSREFASAKEASLFETKIRKWSRAKKAALISNDTEMLQTLSECRNATHSQYK